MKNRVSKVASERPQPNHKMVPTLGGGIESVWEFDQPNRFHPLIKLTLTWRLKAELSSTESL